MTLMIVKLQIWSVKSYINSHYTQFHSDLESKEVLGLVGQIDIFKNYSYSIGLWGKNVDMNIR